MAKSKVKEVKVTHKGEKGQRKPKAKETARAKPSQLSEENVLESGSESDSGSSGGGSDTESEDEKRRNTKKADVRKVAETEPAEPAVPDDESEEESSEESSEVESSEEEDKKAKAAPKKSSKAETKTNGMKRKADESSSAESESDDELPDAPAAKKARSESEESEGESEEDDKADKADKADKMDVDKPALPPGVVASVPAQPFEPPSGYTAFETQGKSTLTDSDLKGKQIWHITAPVDVPISSLTEVALDAIQSGKPVMSHKGLDYMLSEDKGQKDSGSALLLPGKGGYAPIQQPIARTLHLKQHIVLPNLSEKQADQLTGSNVAGDAATAAVTAVRPQPKGLIMRYRPPGFGSGNPGRIGSDTESEEEEAQPVGKEAVFQFPKKPEVSGAGKKEKKDKKDKKEKKSKKKP